MASPPTARPSRDAGVASDQRTANLLGALALTLADRTDAALRDGAGVSGSDAAALVTLRNYAEGEPLDLLRSALALSHPGVVRLADRLQARGLVERQRSDRDGRAVALRLTPAGRRAADDALAARAGAIGAALGALDAAQRRALGPMLERMLGAQTTDAVASLVICRLCDPGVCGHPRRCPVTQAARGL
jgi:DNA-binding MarR family transcriptional regulator